MTDEIIIEALRIAAESEKNPALKMLLEIAPFTFFLQNKP